jgi:hypothetical protein
MPVVDKKEAGAGFKPVPTGIPLSFLRRGIGRGSSMQKGRKKASLSLDSPYYKLQTSNFKLYSAGLRSAFEKKIDEVYNVVDSHISVTIGISCF